MPRNLRHQIVSILIGLSMTVLCAWVGYSYIERNSQNEYIKSPSRFFDNLEIMQHRYDDLKLALQPPRETKAKVALIAIDDESIGEIGRWPWSREVMYQMTQNLINSGVKSVTFDIVFSEPERENPEADVRMGELVKANPEKIILGTAATSKVSPLTPPYQDICRLEAFLHYGGDAIIKPNLTFIVDDETENFETYNWHSLFNSLFVNLADVTRHRFDRQYALGTNLPRSRFQRNALQNMIVKEANDYCDSWLTPNDIFLDKNNPQLVLNLYENVVGKKLDQKTLEQEFARIKKIKPHPIQQYTGWLSNVPAIQEPAAYTAGFNVDFDSLGLIRHYDLLNRTGFKIGSSYVPSLAMQMYLLSEQKRAEILIANSPDRDEKYIKEFQIVDVDTEKENTRATNLEIDVRGRLRINYLGGTNSFYYVSAKDLLHAGDKIRATIRNAAGNKTEQSFDKKEFFKDRSVIVGATALGVGDIRNTPTQVAMPGTETHLHAYANLIDGNSILDIQNPLHVIPLLTLALGFIFTIIWTLTSSLIAPLVLAVALVGLYLIDIELFNSQKIMTTTWPLFFTLITSFSGVLLFKYFTEERNKRQIRRAFAKYVSPAVVDELLKSEKNLELGGRKQRLTVMFSDLRGFTSLSEQLSPEQLSNFLKTYFTKMTEEVFKYNGTLDKFIGDAVMAFFGAPLSYKNNAENACRCSLDSLKRLEELNRDLEFKGFPKLQMGIGVNTGEMSVGNMGSATLQNYTVLGDSVNLASRLESLNKDYGTQIIIGPATYAEVGEMFVCREIDTVRVKGKNEVVSIYELIADASEKAAFAEWLETFNEAKTLYKQRLFAQAEIVFKKCQNLNSQDKTSQIFADRCRSYIQTPPAPDWDGVHNLEHK